MPAPGRRDHRRHAFHVIGERGEFALAILDIGLPDVSGLEVLKQIRQRAPGLPALIITAHGNLDNAVAARKLGAEAYLVKLITRWRY